MALDLEIILRETAANFAATTLLPELEKAEFAKIPEGTTKTIKGKSYYLKDSRWRSTETDELLENNLEKADRDETAAEDKITRSEDRQARKELMESLAKTKPYTLKMVDGGHEITKSGNTLDLGDMKITRSPQTIKITTDGSGHRVQIGAGSSAVLSGGVTTNYDSPAESYQVSHSPIKISAGSSQLQIHDFLYHPDQGILKKPHGQYAQFEKSVNQSKELTGIAAIHAFEREKYKQSFESAMVVDFRGQKAFTKDGTSDQVAFTSEEVNQMASGILSHNHPDGWNFEAVDTRSGGNSFSRDDLEIAVGADLSEIRAISRKYIHSILRPPNGWPSLSAAKKMIATIEATQQHQGGRRLYNSQQMDSPEEFQKLQNKMNADYWHDLATSYADLIGAKYTRKEHEYQ
jgi:hypothetical protein